MKAWLYWLSPERFRIWDGCRRLNRRYGTRGNFSLKSCLWCYLTKKYPSCRNENLSRVP